MLTITVKEVFEKAGLEDIRPTENALQEMGISRKRFSQIIENSAKSPVTVSELEAIRRWMNGLSALSTESLIEQKDNSNYLPV